MTTTTLNASVAGAQIHVVPATAAAYRQEGGPADALEAQRHLRRVLAGAHPIARELARIDPAGLEAWGALDEEYARRITAYVIRWRVHVVVLAVSTRDARDATIASATWTRAALTAYAASRGIDLADAAAPELTLACWDARAVDVGGTPETWRWRNRLVGLDVSLAVQRTRESAPLVIAAEARHLNASSASRKR